MYKTLELTLDTERTNNTKTNAQNFLVNTNDYESIKIIADIVQDKERVDLSDATVKLAIRKPDQTIVFQDGTVTAAIEGECEFVLETQSYVLKGTHVAEVMIYFADGKIVVTRAFAYHVAEGILSDAAIESTSWYQDVNELQLAVQELQVEVDAFIDTAVAETRAEITEVDQRLTSQLADIATMPSTEEQLRNALVSGKPVILNSTIAVTSTIEVPLDMPLYFDGRGKGKILFTGTGAFLKVNRSRKAVVKDFEIEGTGQFNGQVGIHFSSPNDSNLSEGSNSVEISGVVGTKLDTHMVLNTIYNSAIYKNRGRLIRKGIVVRGKCMENEFYGNVMLASFRALIIEKSENTSYVANGFFPEGQYFSGGNTFDLYGDALEPEKDTAATIFIQSGYDIRFTANYIANLNVNYGKLIQVKLDDAEYNQCFYISFANNGLHGRNIEVLDAKANALYPYVITFSDNQVNFSVGKFALTNANLVKIVGNQLKVDHDDRIADIVGSNNIDLTANTIYYGNSTNPTNLADTCINIENSNDISVNDNDIVYAFKTVSNPVVTETNSQRVRNLNNKHKYKTNYAEVGLASGGKVCFWRNGDIVMGSIYTNTEVIANDSEIVVYPTGFKPTNTMPNNTEFPFATGGGNRIALRNNGIRFFGTSQNFMRCSFFYVSQ